MFSEVVYLFTSILGTITVIYFVVSKTTTKKSEVYILSDVSFLKKENTKNNGRFQ